MKERIENLKKALGFTLLFEEWACFWVFMSEIYLAQNAQLLVQTSVSFKGTVKQISEKTKLDQMISGLNRFMSTLTYMVGLGASSSSIKLTFMARF